MPPIIQPVHRKHLGNFRITKYLMVNENIYSLGCSLFRIQKIHVDNKEHIWCMYMDQYRPMFN